MALTSILRQECPECKKIAVEKSRIKFGTQLRITLACGHVIKSAILKKTTDAAYESIVFSDGGKPRPYQIEAIRFAEDSNMRCIIADEQGLGKGQILSDTILTPNGFKTFEDIKIGDDVFSNDGKIYQITGVYDRGVLPVYKVEFADGTFATVDGEHLWSVQSHNDRNRNKPYKTIQTNVLYERLTKDWKSGREYLFIPTTEAIQFPIRQIPIDAYQLGVLIGDGNLTQYQVSFVSGDKEIADAFPVIRRSEQNSENSRVYFLERDYSDDIIKLGLYGHKSESKFIPPAYLYNTIEIRTEILKGLMDTDGSIWKNGVTEYTTVSEQLSKDVRFLVESLGGTVKITFKHPTFTYKGEKRKGQLAYRIVINSPVNPFRLSRKASKWHPNTKYKPVRSIKSIELVSVEPVRCISVNSPSRLYITNNCIVTHNTIESASLLRLHPEKLLPCVIVCPATVKLQWMHEIHRICAINGAKDKTFLTQVIASGKERAMPGFSIYVVTYDILKTDDLFEYLPPNTIKTLIIDECQKIKNHLSDRAKAVRKLVRNQDIQHILPMSGTPISNNAAEYYTVLNLVAPMLFPHFQRYIDNYVDSYSNGWANKYGGLKDKDKFHEDIKNLIIRRTKSEVLKDLPSKERKYHHVELNRNLNKEYAAAMKELEASFYNDAGDYGPQDPKIAIMSKMRHITGRSKVVEVVDFATEFLLSTDRKLVIFTHHQDVMGMIELKLNEYMKDGGFPKVCVLHAGLPGDDRQRVIDKFKLPENRIMLCIFTEGINLQFCSDAVILERQWTPVREEQAEDRFHRFGQQNNVSITYMIAAGTIDEYLTELVEIKRARIAATMDNQEIVWNQQSLMKELAEILVTRGQNAWRL